MAFTQKKPGIGEHSRSLSIAQSSVEPSRNSRLSDTEAKAYCDRNMAMLVKICSDGKRKKFFMHIRRSISCYSPCVARLWHDSPRKHNFPERNSR